MLRAVLLCARVRGWVFTYLVPRESLDAHVDKGCHHPVVELAVARVALDTGAVGDADVGAGGVDAPVHGSARRRKEEAGGEVNEMDTRQYACEN